MLQTIIAFHSSPYGNEWNYKYIPFLLNNFFCGRFSFVKLNIASFRLKTKLKRGCLKIELLKQKSYRLKLKSKKSPGFSHIIKIDES